MSAIGKVFVSLALLMCLVHSSCSYVNNWDQPIRFQCNNGGHIARIDSIHDNGKEDRRWDYRCNYNLDISNDCSWSGHVNSLDDPMLFECSGDGVISGFRSDHDNGKEDRRWQIRCCQSNVMPVLCHISLSYRLKVLTIAYAGKCFFK